MDQKLIQAISHEIYRRFPEVQGNRPKVRMLNLPKPRPISRSPIYLLIFQGRPLTSPVKNNAAGKVLPYYVRVVANEQGRILKISMSH